MNGWLRRVQDALWPADCLLCGGSAGAGPNLCAGCAGDLPWIETACPACGLALPGIYSCPRCQRRAPAFSGALCALRYEPPVTWLVYQLKYRRRLAAADALGAALVRRLRALDGTRRPDVLVPVPLHPSRLRARGYNQALELARSVAPALDLPLRAGALRRVRSTPPQTGMTSRRERRRNLAGAFVAPRPLGGAAVALLDDVLTTGATAEAAARALRRAGAARVEVWAAARAS